MEEALASLKKNLRYLQRLDIHHFHDYQLEVVLPSTLTKVTLYDSNGLNMLKSLGKLPNLLHLRMQNSHEPKSLDISVVAANSFRNKLWESNFVKEETVDEFNTNWELTMINGCKVGASSEFVPIKSHQDSTNISESGAGGFPQLEVFEKWELERRINVKPSASCHQRMLSYLKHLPDEIWFLPAL
ncbi:hypothetical protein FEM48_Zijuj04G0172200 [Ziziphus jujuba var. spinosa]|uniref:Uncharacterized protein n=1 Tax=Ziziphus jujuba var. spinosa TaxID=714518 RepID=A0A978VL50_ZIZJJ|nr:hypothetical protein FEM48_Zijuj04G0172200 [Ziziphus jujuba var. spinosa]